MSPFHLVSIHFPFSNSETHKFQTQRQAQSFSSLTFTTSHTGICKRACVVHSSSSVRAGKHCQIQTSMCYSVCLTFNHCIFKARWILFVIKINGNFHRKCPLCFFLEGNIAVALQGICSKSVYSFHYMYVCVGDIFYTTGGPGYF